MKKIILLCICLGIMFAVDPTGKIRIVKDNGKIVFYKNDREFKVIKPQSSVRMLSYSEFEEQDLPLQLHGVVSLTSLSNSSVILSAAKDPANIKVAVIDTGLDLNNMDLKQYCLINDLELLDNNFDEDGNGIVDDVYGANIIEQNGNVFDDHGHGTYMTSVIAIQSKGNVKVLPIKAFDNNGYSSQFIIANAIIYAVERGVDVINCSFGYPTYTETLRMAVQYALDNGVILVASAGNNGQEILMYPAGFSGVLAVSSLDDNDKLSYFSNYGDHILASSIGEKVSCIGIGGSAAKVSGTSISSAYISGTLANINNFSSKSLEEIVGVFSNDVVYPLGSVRPYPGWDKYTGQGKISNILFSESDEPNPLQSVSNLEINNFLNYPNPIMSVDNSTDFGFYLNEDAQVELKIYSMNGKELWKYEQELNGGSNYNKITYDLYNEFNEPLANDTYIAILRAKSGTQETLKKTVFTVLR